MEEFVTKEQAIKELIEVVNASRFRGVNREGPMTDGYHWPRSFQELEAISQSALRLVLACEAEEKKTSKSCSCEVYETCDICRSNTEKDLAKAREKDGSVSEPPPPWVNDPHERM